MKNIILSLLLFASICFVFAQDSTFVTKYSITGIPWSNHYGNDLSAGNVIVKYNGDLALQALGVYMDPPPEEWIWFQSPIFSYNRNGILQNYTLGPTNEGLLMNGDYSSIIQDRNGGYLALSNFFQSRCIHSLDSEFHYNHINYLYDATNNLIIPYSLYEDSDGFIVTGRQLNPSSFVCAKYDYSNQVI